MRLISFNSVNFPEYGGEHSLPVQARSSLIQLPNGSFDQDGQRSVMDSPTISWRANYVGNSIDVQINTLLTEISKGRGLLRAELRDDGATLITYAKMKSVQRVASADSYNAKQPLQVTFEQDFPFWMNDLDGWFLDSGILLDDGYVLDGLTNSQTISAGSMSFTISYDGTARGIMGSITLTPAAAATLTTIQIFNAANNMQLTWSNTTSPLGSGDILVIDFMTRTVERNGVSDYAHFSLADAKQVEFMALEVGDNLITVTATRSGNTAMDWSYRRLYL